MWLEESLDQLADIKMGQSPDSSSYNDKGYGVAFLQGCAEFGDLYPTANVYCSSPGKIASESSVLISVRAPVGDLNLADKEYCIGRGLAAISGKKVPSKYLYYSIDLNKAHLARLAQGSTFDAIGSKELKNHQVFYPSDTNERQRLIEILETADSSIEKTQALIAKYENIKQGMMQDLFTRGVDESGQLRPSYEDAPHLYQETELGWIPKDWLMEELRYFVPRAEYGVSISCDDNAENIPVLRMNNIYNGEFDVSDLKYAPASELTGLFMKEKDVLFNRTNSWEHVGKTAIWKNQLEKASFASYMVRLVPDTELMIPEFLTYWLQLDDVQTAIRRFATPGVQQVNINPTNLRRTLCAAPKDTTEQLMIVKRIQSIDSKLEQERKVLRKLQRQKLGLMQDLLTGKVRVAEDTEERKEAVA